MPEVNLLIFAAEQELRRRWRRVRPMLIFAGKAVFASIRPRCGAIEP